MCEPVTGRAYLTLDSADAVDVDHIHVYTIYVRIRYKIRIH